MLLGTLGFVAHECEETGCLTSVSVIISWGSRAPASMVGGGSLLLELGLNLVWELLRRESMQAGKGGQKEPQSGWPQVGMV